jgi:opacity protein-like surface antigen
MHPLEGDGMTSRILLAAALGLLASSANAAESGFYVSGEGGGSLLTELRLKGTTDKNEGFSGGYVAGGAFGYDTGYGVRIEINSLYQRNDLNNVDKTATKGHISTTGAMLNMTYEFFNDEHFSPYFGLGFGMESVGGEVGTLRGRAWKPAYQGEIGLRQSLSRHFALFGEYRYVTSGVVNMTDGTTTAHQHFEDNMLFAGFRVNLF